MEPIAIVTALALLEYFAFGIEVARARSRAGIEAPATVGDEIFERHFRVQQNTVEQLVLFLPALWLFGYYVSPLWGAGLGLVFIVGRFLYARGYVSQPSRRGTGFAVGEVAQGLLLLGGLIGAVLSWF
jgi:uncharacterized membrane protein YecN with MAPEG domain